MASAKPRDTRSHHARRTRLRDAHFSALAVAAGPAAGFRGPRAAAEAEPSDRLLFSITWSGGSAALDHLTCNGLLVEERPVYGANLVTVTFDRPQEAVHLFEWTLLFPGATLQNLAATAALNGGAPAALAAKGAQGGLWQASGKA